MYTRLLLGIVILYLLLFGVGFFLKTLIISWIISIIISASYKTIALHFGAIGIDRNIIDLISLSLFLVKNLPDKIYECKNYYRVKR